MGEDFLKKGEHLVKTLVNTFTGVGEHCEDFSSFIYYYILYFSFFCITFLSFCKVSQFENNYRTYSIYKSAKSVHKCSPLEEKSSPKCSPKSSPERKKCSPAYIFTQNIYKHMCHTLYDKLCQRIVI